MSTYTTVVYSPYLLNESAKDLALSLGQKKENSLDDGLEKAEVVLLVDGAPRWTSGFLRLENLRKLDHEVRFSAREKSRIKLKLNYQIQVKGSPLQAVQPLTWSAGPLVRGIRTLRVRGSSVQISGSVQKARARVARRVKPPRSKWLRSRFSTTVRPSPEIINRQFLKVTEVGNQGVLQPAQSARSVVPILAYRRDWTGTRTPGFNTVKSKQLPVNPHTVSIIEVLDDRYTRYQINTFTGAHSLDHRPYSDVYFVPGYQDFGPFADRAGNLALQRLINAAQAGIQANLAQTLAQMNQLTALIAGNATRIVKSLRALKRMNFSGAVSALSSGRSGSGASSSGLSKTKSVASNWLQLQYGWKPLLSDIENFFKILPASTEQSSTFHRVTGSGSVKDEHVVAYPPGDAVIGEQNVGKTTHTSRTSVKYGISYRLDDPTTQFFAQLGFTNPVNLAWEVLPFSFVADWFLPIGSYLETASAFHGLTFLDGYKTTFTRVKMDSAITYGGSVVGVPHTLVNFGATYRRERVILSRERLTAFPSASIPSLRLNPFENSGFTGGTNNRAQNAIALLLQAFK